MTRPVVRLAAAILAMLVVCTAAATASEIRDYSVRLTVDAAGDAVATLDLTAVVSEGELVVPLAYTGVTDLRVRQAPTDARLTLATRDGREVLILMTAASSAPQSISVEFRVPGVMAQPLASGHRVIRHQLLNTRSVPLERYLVTVVFPDAWRAHAVREGAPRVRLEAVEGAPGARFEVTNLLQGESATMRIEMVARQRSWSWLLVGLLLAVGYLISFRDLIRPAGR
jgi:hypothetical protein